MSPLSSLIKAEMSNTQMDVVTILLIYVHSNLVEKILLFPLILYFRRCPHVTASLCLIFTTITYQKPDQIEIETC